MQKVVLYKNGVGYFEHVGKVKDRQQVEIGFTSGQLNDVLKSLTVLDLNGGRISGVEYGSKTPADRELGDLRLPVGEKATLTEFLGALRGARLEVRSAATVISGRLLSVERKTRTGGGTTLEVDYVSLLTDSGELKTTELSPQFSVRLLDAGLGGKVGRYLDLAASSREQDVRRMSITADGTGDRSLFVSYVSEVPIWKSTYRVVLSPKKAEKPLLQGWAIVDNTVGQDWENVEMSLVAGAPQSFIQNLSQPYYSRRPVVPLPESLNTAPQTYEATLRVGGATVRGAVTDPIGGAVHGATVRAYDSSGSLVGQATASANGNYEIAGLPDGVVRLVFESPGFSTYVVDGVAASADRFTRQDARLPVGSVAETIDVSASAGKGNTSSSSTRSTMLGSGAGLGGRARQFVPPGRVAAIAGNLNSFERLVQTPAASQAQNLGDLFEYKLKEPITIRKNRSALVPIVNSPIDAEKVSLWNESAGLPRPLRVLWLHNTSGLTLDGGSFTVLEKDTYAGEGVFEPIRPGEKRLVSYAVDLAVNASSKNSTERQRVTRCRVKDGVITHEREVRERKTYTFRNEDSEPRTVVVEHPARAGWVLRGATQPVETSAGWQRFRLSVPAKETATLEVEEAQPVESTYQISDVDADQVALFVRDKTVHPALEAALRRVLAQKDVVNELEKKSGNLTSESDTIYDDQERLRENMKSLKGSAEEKALLQRYTKRLDEQETRLEAIRTESAKLDAELARARDVLSRMIAEIAFDEKL